MVRATDTTESSSGTSVGEGPRTTSPLAKAWISIALVPVFFFTFAAAQGIYALTGFDPSAAATPPLWADLAAGLPALAILLIPCVSGVVYGRRAARASVRAGLLPATIAALLGVGAVLLVFLNMA